MLVGNLLGSSQGTVTKTGGTLATGTNADASDPDLEIGVFGTGVITQTAGTINAGDDLVLGHEAGSNGTCNVEGGSVNVDNGVFVGVRGSGTLSVSGGGQLDVAGHLFVGDDLNSNGSVNVNRASASVDITDSLVGGGRDISQSGQGSLTISDGAVNVGSSLKI